MARAYAFETCGGFLIAFQIQTKKTKYKHICLKIKYAYSGFDIRQKTLKHGTQLYSFAMLKLKRAFYAKRRQNVPKSTKIRPLNEE